MITSGMEPPRCLPPLNTLDGKCDGTCMERHRHQEWLKFLRLIDHQTLADKQLHLIVDNYATHKHPRFCAGRRATKRFISTSRHQQQLAQHGRAILPRP